MLREIILHIFRRTRLCVTACGIMHSRCCRQVAWKRRNWLSMSYNWLSMSYRFADSLWAEANVLAHKLSAKLYDILNQFLRFQATCQQHRRCIIPQAVIHRLVLLNMGKIIARNMLSWLELLIELYCCILFVVYIIYINDTRSKKYQIMKYISW